MSLYEKNIMGDVKNEQLINSYVKFKAKKNMSK